MNSIDQLLIRYNSLRTEAREFVHQGRADLAESHYHSALQIARDIGDPDVEDQAYCNLFAVRLGRHSDEEGLPRLRQILTRNGSPENCFLAAYNLARAYEHRKEHKKGLFYARIALERIKSLQEQSPEWLGMALNQLGNLLVAESFFAEAVGSYEAALELSPPPPRLLRALIDQNIGYCLVMTDRPRDGLSRLYRSLRTLRVQPHMMPQVHLDIALAHLELGRHRDALRHGVKALTVAEQQDRPDEVKNALYLVGEAANLEGNEDLARRYFDQLQDYFPQTPFLSDFLLATDVRQLINMRA